MTPGGPLAWRLFEVGFGPWMRRRIRVHVAGLADRDPLPGRPLLLCANHESFWDGFLLRELQRRLRPTAPFRAVMLEAELRKHPWLAALGAVGVAPGSAGSTRALLRTLRGVAAHSPRSVFAFFPQGRIRPDDPRPVGFRKGVAAVAAALAPAVVVPVGLRVLPGRSPRGEAYLSVGPAREVDVGQALSVARLEGAVAEELDAIGALLAAHGEDAPVRWPVGGEPLPRATLPARRGSPTEPWISTN